MSSIHDVAKAAGVSAATVSRMFRAPDSVSLETRARVEEAATRAGYRPRRWTASAAADETADAAQTLGFQFFSEWRDDTLQANPFYAAVLAGAQREADVLGLYLLVNTTDRHRLSAEMPRMIREAALSGLLLVGTADPEILSVFAAAVPHLVLVDNREATIRHDCILSDGAGGAACATRYLMELGHRRIGFALGDARAVTFQDRLQGYLGALIGAGQHADPRFIISADGPERLKEALLQRLAEPDRPTALLCANDNHAFTVLDACRQAGLRVPQDLSVIGFDDLPFLSHATPPLTTLRVDTEQIGRQAVRRLHARLRADAEATEPPFQIVIPTTLILRDSCAPPPVE